MDNQPNVIKVAPIGVGTTRVHPRSLSDAFPDARAQALFGPYTDLNYWLATRVIWGIILTALVAVWWSV
jgi:predicted ATPase